MSAWLTMPTSSRRPLGDVEHGVVLADVGPADARPARSRGRNEAEAGMATGEVWRATRQHACFHASLGTRMVGLAPTLGARLVLNA